ncbi:ATP-dependent RNA helicase DDX18, partial [Galemys pyrenaicus]
MVDDIGPDSKTNKQTKQQKKTPEETENSMEKPGDKKDNYEVPSLPLELTGAFEDAHLVLQGIREMGFVNMAEIQHQISPTLEGRDFLAAAKMVRGKTLAFLIPVMELIVKLKFMPETEQRYLSSHLLENWPCRLCVSKELMSYHVHTYKLIMSDNIRSAEAQKLTNRFNINVSTSSCLLDHLQSTLGLCVRPPVSGKAKQNKQITTLFCGADPEILLHIDEAARGMDVPEVVWIVQYDHADDPKEYTDRVGRKAGGLNVRGHALLTLHPEVRFPSFLQAFQGFIKSLMLKLRFPSVALSHSFKVSPFVDLNMNANEGKQSKRG